MKQRFGIVAAVAAMLAVSLAPPAARAEGDSTQDYLFKPDFFNTRLTAEQQAAPQPTRGGSVTLRVPTEEKDLNPLTSNSAGASTIIGLSLTDPLMSQDPESYEWVPWVAERWQVQDILLFNDDSQRVGLIVEMDGTLLEPKRLVFQAGAALVTVAKHDLNTELSDTPAGRVVLKNGTVLNGSVEELTYTLRVTTHGEGEAEEIDLASLKPLNEKTLSGADQIRLGIQKQCLWRLHLRQGVTWQDGEPIKPADAALFLGTLRNQYVDCTHARNYYEDFESVNDAGDGVVEARLKRPYSRSYRIVAALTLLPSHIIDAKAYEGDEQAYGEYFNQLAMYRPGTSNPVGMGSYRVARWTDNRVELERWDGWWASTADLPYWSKGAPYLDKLVFQTISNNAAALSAIKEGTIDADFDIEPSTWVLDETNTDEFKSKIVRAKIVTPMFVYIGWNQLNPLFKERDVRLALAMLIPRERILKEVHHGMGTLVTGPYYINGPIYDHDVPQVPYDPAEARRILRRLGWGDRDGDGVLDKDGQRFEFSYLIHPARAYHRQVAEIIKEDLGKSGILMDIQQLEWAILGDRVRDQKFDAVRFAWQLSGFDDPDQVQIFHSSQAKEGGSNYVGYKSAEADRLMEAIRLEFDHKKRMDMNRELHRIISNDQPYVFLYSFEEPYFYNNRIRNVKFYGLPPGYDFREWYVEK